MKKFFLMFVLFSPLNLFAAENNIKMVTYFPVPYASYQNLDVEKTLDVGVMACAMNLTCPTNQYALNVYEDANAGSSVLKKGYLRVTSGRLDLNSSGKAVSKVMTVGNHSGSGGELDFGQDLRVNTLVNRGQSLQAANDGNVLTALRMFPDHITNNFPACSGVDGAPDVSWQSLELGAQDNKAVTNVFLVCGKPKAGEAAPEKECTAGQREEKTGVPACSKRYRICSSDGKWGAWITDDSGCKKIRCLVDVHCHGNPYGCGSNWQPAHYTQDMMLETGASGLTSCKLGQECDCEVGKKYLHSYMVGCCAGGKYCSSYSSYVYHSATCAEVDSLSRCAQGNIGGSTGTHPVCIGGGLTPKPMD